MQLSIITMMQREISLSKQNFTGKKCQICTGCGCCLGGPDLHVVMTRKEAWAEREEPIFSPSGGRLVTADIGTTTIALQLYDREGHVTTDYAAVNPQVRFGADVLSRIQAAQDPKNREQMRSEVRAKLVDALECFRTHLQPGETMYMVLAGNTTMIYLLMGFDPAELGRAPFTASYLDGLEIDIETKNGVVPCTVFPGLSAFVGGDIAAGMYACGMQEREEVTLLIDLGTNGEMVLGNRHRRIACATAAGPAFEGGVNRGVWGADMVHLLATLKREGIVDDTGLLADDYFEEGILIGNVHVTQEAIRAIQLAKGAIGAGICILMKEYGLEDIEKIDRVILAGGFGYYLNPEDAAEIGLLPKELAAKASAGGNTALAGALRLGREILARGGVAAVCGRAEAEGVAEQSAADVEFESNLGILGTEIINLATCPDFQELYIRHMNLNTYEID